MITQSEYDSARQKAAAILQNTGLTLRPDEIDSMEVADFGLSELEISGAQILTLINTEQIAVKLLVLFPHQIEPEHTHVRLGQYAGKEETIRCEWGELYLYAAGDPTPNPKGQPPVHRLNTYTVWHEYILHPGEQITFEPNIPHWFQSGTEGVVIWSFSTKAVDGKDVFTDPAIVRQTLIIESHPD
jgi:D-lyxose ketol-isomerase